MRILHLLITILILNVFSVHAEYVQEKKSGIAAIPLMGYTPDTGLVISAAVTAYNNPDPENPDQKKDNAAAAVFYTLENQSGIALAFEKYLHENDYKLSSEISFSAAPTEFYGTGINVSDEDEEKYNNRSFNLKSSFMNEITPNIYLGPEIRFYTDSLDEKETMLASGTFTGSEGITQFGTGAVITIDTRDSYSYPSSGIFYNISGNIFTKNAGSDYSYNHLKIDLRHYYPLSEKFTAGINAHYEGTAGDVPFQVLPQLGGGTTLRGFLSTKYKDKHYISMQTELRYSTGGIFGGVLFAGAGTIAPEIYRLGFDEIKIAAGGGLRINLIKQQQLNLRIDIARSNDNETNMYIGLMEAF